MFALAAHALPEAVATEAGRIFTLDAPLAPWLAPACILAGLAAQLGALMFLRARKGPLGARVGLVCVTGACLVFAGAALDRDLSVAVGEALALAGIRFAWRKG